MQFFVEKAIKHLLKTDIFRNFASEFIAGAMVVPLGVHGIGYAVEGTKPL